MSSKGRGGGGGVRRPFSCTDYSKLIDWKNQVTAEKKIHVIFA
jgi:hypothetical protein